MIKEFLKNSLIDIQSDEDLSKLVTASEEIAKKLIKDKSKIVPYTLIAIDPEISPKNKDIDDVSNTIMDFWKTFASQNRDTPLTIVRAVILESLEKISENTNIAAAIWLISRNIIRYLKLGREKEILEAFLQKLKNNFDRVSVVNWSLPIELKPKKLAIVLKDLSTLPEEDHLKEISVNFNQFQEKINQLLVDFQKEIIDKTNLLQLRNQLLWWKEAAYSISGGKGYKEYEPGTLQIILAKDFSTFVPSIYPTVMDYYLVETEKQLTNSEDNHMKISKFLSLLENQTDILQDFFTEYTITENRIPFIDFVRGLIWKKFKAKDFKAFVGISDGIEITFEEITSWIFHDLQTLKILSK